MRWSRGASVRVSKNLSDTTRRDTWREGEANTSTANVLRGNSAWSTRGVLSLIGSFLAAASSATLASSPAWASTCRQMLLALPTDT